MPDLVPAVVPEGTLRGRPQPLLDAGGLHLRPWEPADVDALVTAYADPAIQQWHARSMTPDEAADWIARWACNWQDETAASWAVTSDGVVVGRAGLRGIRLGEGWAEVAYWTTAPARGRGVAGRALDALTRWAFDDVGLHRLELNHATSNLASCAVATRAGYAVEGTRRSQLRHADGWHDMHLHARLADDR